ncbi:MAG: hypothetical protein ACRCT2_06510 [Plesiomonas shigelloides]
MPASFSAPERTVRVDGNPMKAILDSGSSLCLLRANVLPREMEKTSWLPITCVHGETRDVWSCQVEIAAKVPVLLGRDWPGFDQLLKTVVQP